MKIICKDITEIEVDAIVNAANTELKNYAPIKGGGVCGAIFRAAGHKQLQAACDYLAPIETGQAAITSGFALPAKHIIHTAGPVWNGGNHNENTALRNCYLNCLEIAIANGIKTIAFPCISTGIYCFPINLAAQIAVDTVKEFLWYNDGIEEVYFVCADEQNYNEYTRSLNRGNTVGNIANGGFAAQSGGWIYYSNTSYMSRPYVSCDHSGNGRLYKIRADGSGKTKLCDDCCDYINVIGDWIYYRNKSDGHKPYKIHTDGSGRNKLSDGLYNEPVWDYQEIGDWLFYIDCSGNICKRYTGVDDNENNDEILLVDGDCGCVNVSGDLIYYFNYGDACIYKMRLDGSEKTKLVDLLDKHSKCNGICVLDDRLAWINEYWFMHEGISLNLKSVRTDGTKDDFQF